MLSYLPNTRTSFAFSMRFWSWCMPIAKYSLRQLPRFMRWRLFEEHEIISTWSRLKIDYAFELPSHEENKSLNLILISPLPCWFFLVHGLCCDIWTLLKSTPFPLRLGMRGQWSYCLFILAPDPMILAARCWFRTSWTAGSSAHSQKFETIVVAGPLYRLWIFWNWPQLCNVDFFTTKLHIKRIH